LFLFADGAPIGDEGLLWLKAHVARCADGNKWSTIERPGNLDFAGRIAWTNDNVEVLRKIGTAVLRGDDPAQWEWVLQTRITPLRFRGEDDKGSDWTRQLFIEGDTKADGITDPYQFVAACAEFAEALDAGPGFNTRLPLMFDATCSGLQHLCAMLRAEEGRLVNLTKPDGGSPYDFYSLVGAVVWKKHPELRHFFKGGNPFDRKFIKRPGMTYGYGSKAGGWLETKRGRYRPKGMTEQIVEVLKERGQSTKGAHKLAKAAYDVIEKLMPAVKENRRFLEKIAKVCTKHNIPLRWPTILGLPVLGTYYEPIIETISVKIDGQRRRTNLIVGDTKISPQGP